MELLNKVLDCIFPPCCCICGEIGKVHICKKCEIQLKKFIYMNNEKEFKENRYHLFEYKGIIREKMIQYKFNDKSYMYHMFCEILLKDKKTCEFLKYYDIIIPVPIHSKRKRIRGYNQSELIAIKVAKEIGIEIYKDVLIKIKNTKPQSLMNKYERKQNVQDVYNVKK